MVSHAKHGHHLVRLRDRWQDGRRLSGAEGLRSGDEQKAARGGETGGLQALERLDSCLGPMTVLQSWSEVGVCVWGRQPIGHLGLELHLADRDVFWRRLCHACTELYGLSEAL